MTLPLTVEENEFAKDRRRFVIICIMGSAICLAFIGAFVLAVMPVTMGDPELKRTTQTGFFGFATALCGFIVGQYQKK